MCPMRKIKIWWGGRAERAQHLHPNNSPRYSTPQIIRIRPCRVSHIMSFGPDLPQIIPYFVCLPCRIAIRFQEQSACFVSTISFLIFQPVIALVKNINELSKCPCCCRSQLIPPASHKERINVSHKSDQDFDVRAFGMA